MAASPQPPADQDDSLQEGLDTLADALEEHLNDPGARRILKLSMADPQYWEDYGRDYL